MKLAILSDIHGNLEAFRAVLTDVGNQDVDEILNLGDFIDYGPNSNEVSQIIRNSAIKTIIGNHEYIFFDPEEINRFSHNAAVSFKITRENLPRKFVSWIKSLPKIKILNNRTIRCVHGMPPNSVHEYLSYQSQYRLLNIFRELEERIVFVGHTHIQDLIKFNESDQKPVRVRLGKEKYKLEENTKYIVNGGSVGQPREKNKQAKYIIYDTEKELLIPRFVDYEIGKTVAKIRNSDYPDKNADILLP